MEECLHVCVVMHELKVSFLFFAGLANVRKSVVTPAMVLVSKGDAGNFVRGADFFFEIVGPYERGGNSMADDCYFEEQVAIVFSEEEGKAGNLTWGSGDEHFSALFEEVFGLGEGTANV